MESSYVCIDHYSSLANFGAGGLWVEAQTGQHLQVWALSLLVVCYQWIGGFSTKRHFVLSKSLNSQVQADWATFRPISSLLMVSR